MERFLVVKIRTGFVSNSSSSSYICDICGEVVSGWDMGLDEAGMFECVKGHVFCEEHAVEKPHYTKKQMKELFEKEKSWIGKEDMKNILETIEKGDEFEMEELISDYLEDGRYNILSEQCPLCSLIEITDSDRIDYLMIESGFTYQTFMKEIRERFKDYDEFRKYCRDNISIVKT